MTGPTHPGVFIDEIPFRGRSIEGVSTSTTAFLGGATRGPMDEPRLVASVAEFERVFGTPSLRMPLGLAVRQFFDNGGRRAVICRIRGARRGATLTDRDVSDPALEADQRGLWLLDQTEDVNTIVIPPLADGVDVGRQTWDAAAAYARRHRQMLIVDPPRTWRDAADMSPAAVDAVIGPGDHRMNAALYVPWIVAAGTAQAPSGAVAGVWARTDLVSGVWRSPAGAHAALAGTTGLTVTLPRSEADELNTRGINTIREFPGQPPALWGARTLHGADVQPSDWKYVTVRRTALFIERSIDHGTQWAAFEPNCEPLWAELRLRVGGFLTTLFSQGAFPGQVPKEGYYVKCDATTTTQDDIDNGRLNLLVGFAPIKPAEFVNLRFAIRAGPGCP